MNAQNIGPDFDPIVEAALLGIRVRHRDDADDLGELDLRRRTITTRPGTRAYVRTTVTYQLAYAVLGTGATREQAIEWAASLLIPDDDLYALASATDDRALWARALQVRPCLLLAHAAMLGGLPVAA